MYFSIRKQPPTREQIQMQIGDIDAKIAMLESLHSGAGIPSEASDFIKKANDESSKAENEVKKKTEDVQKKKFSCFMTLCNGNEYR